MSYGFTSTAARYSNRQLAFASIGDGLTDAEALAFYNAVANHGKFMKPQFVKKITRGQDLVKEFQPIVLKQKICLFVPIVILKYLMDKFYL